MTSTTTECEFCGEELPPRYIDNPVKASGKHAPLSRIMIGRVACNCEGATAARLEAMEAEDARKAAERAARLEANLKKSGIPARYLSATHDKAETMAEAVIAGKGFYIHGAQGTLKTTLAMSVSRLLVERGTDVFAIASYDLMDAMKSWAPNDRALYNRARECKVLVLDDLGKEASNTPASCERLFAIIDTRDKELLPIIATSNYKLSDLAKKITEGDAGKSIASRLRGSTTQVAMYGEDRRLNRG